MTTKAEPAGRPALVLVRHGETEGESSIRYHGRTDVPLSDLGREQMRAARDAISRRFDRFAHVFASPLSRALEGARIVVGDSAPLTILDEFVEVHFGLFEGLTADEIRERHPAEFELWNADRLSPAYTYPQGESRAAFAARVERGVERMFSIWNPPGSRGHALMVAHRGVIRTAVTHLTGAQPLVELGSIQILEFDGQWLPVALDVIDHLR